MYKVGNKVVTFDQFKVIQNGIKSFKCLFDDSSHLLSFFNPKERNLVVDNNFYNLNQGFKERYESNFATINNVILLQKVMLYSKDQNFTVDEKLKSSLIKLNQEFKCIKNLESELADSEGILRQLVQAELMLRVKVDRQNIVVTEQDRNNFRASNPSFKGDVNQAVIQLKKVRDMVVLFEGIGRQTLDESFWIDKVQ
jgi:hypothetical protein